MNARCVKCKQFLPEAQYEIAKDGKAQAYIAHVCPDAKESERQTAESVTFHGKQDQ